MYLLSRKQSACKSVPFLVIRNPTRIFYLHYNRGAEMRLLNRLWEGKERKIRDHHVKTFEILIKVVNVPPLQLGTAFSRGSCVREELQDCSASSIRLWGLKELPLAAYPKNRALPWKVKNEHNLPSEREFPRLARKRQHPQSLPDIAGKKGIGSQAGTFRLSVLPVTHLKGLKGIPLPFLPSEKKPAMLQLCSCLDATPKGYECVKEKDHHWVKYF